MSSPSVPQSFVCPITGVIMTDPVVDPEGNTYERLAIMDWLTVNATSPMTRGPLKAEDLVSNRALLDLINDFKMQNPEAAASQFEPRVPKPSVPDQKQLQRDGQEHKEDDEKQDQDINTPAPSVELTATPYTLINTTNSINTNEYLIDIALTPPQGKTPVPMDIVVVVDVSGSMSARAPVDGAEDAGFTVMDVTKHALNTVIESMRPCDRVSVVSFSNNAKVVVPLVAMDVSGKAQARQLVADLSPGGGTNLWGGLHKGLEELESVVAPSSSQHRQRVPSVFLFTDGIPSSFLSPPRGIVPSLERYLAKRDCSAAAPSIYTFGFGYSLDTELLVKLAGVGRGCFSFIPDAGFVGTVLVHTVANVSTTVAQGAQLRVEVGERMTAERAVGYTPQNPGDDDDDDEDDDENDDDSQSDYNTQTLVLDTAHCGQTKHVLVRVRGRPADSSTPILTATLQYINNDGRMVEETTRVRAVDAEDGDDDGPRVLDASLVDAPKTIVRENMRLGFVDAMATVLRSASLEEQQTVVAEFISKNERYKEKAFPLLTDAKGQVSEAVSKTSWYKKWGKNYLYSLMTAHRQQRCNNFKDPGVAVYGGPLFQAERDRCDDIFSNLEPPKPSGNVSHYGGGSAAPVDFANIYNNCSNPCFHADALLAMADDTSKRVADVRKGDRVLGGARVLGVVETLCENERELMSTLPSANERAALVITPWHPVRDPATHRWVFPEDLAAPSPTQCPAVYSIVLEPGYSSVTLNGYECVTLGHNLKEEVAAHPYYGTSRVLEDLARMPGYTRTGKATFRPGCVRRDGEGKVVGFDKDMLVLPADEKSVC